MKTVLILLTFITSLSAYANEISISNKLICGVNVYEIMAPVVVDKICLNNLEDDKVKNFTIEYDDGTQEVLNIVSSNTNDDAQVEFTVENEDGDRSLFILTLEKDGSFFKDENYSLSGMASTGPIFLAMLQEGEFKY